MLSMAWSLTSCTFTSKVFERLPDLFKDIIVRRMNNDEVEQETLTWSSFVVFMIRNGMNNITVQLLLDSHLGWSG